MHTVGQQPAEPAGVLSLGLRHVADPHLEVLAVGVDRAHHHLISEHELQVDLIRRDFDRPIAAGDAGEDEHAILAERLHTLEHNGRVTRRLEDQVEGAVLARAFQDRQIRR